MKKISWLIVINFLISLTVSGQEKPVFNHYYANPYLINSAFAGEDYRPSIYISHRRQWMGIADAPVTSSIVFHTPLGDKFSLGAQFNNDSRGLLNSSSGLFTLAYKAMFSPEHFLKFGLSGGVINRTIRDLDEIMNDPRYQDDDAVLKLLDKSMYLDGRFGFNYHNKGFNLGFTLPRLFHNELFGVKGFNQGDLNPLNSYQVMAHYQSYNKEAPITFEPYLIYRIQEDGKEKQLEGAGIVKIKNAVWLGGIYRQDGAITALGGITISDAFHFGYSYDVGAQPVTGFGKGTHEIMLKLNLGEEKRPKKKERVVITKEPDAYEQYQQVKEDDPIVQEPPKNDLEDPEGKITNYKGPVEVPEGSQPQDLKKGYYVVVGVFNSLEKAQKYSNGLFQAGYFTKNGYNSTAKYYFVYMYYNDVDKSSAEWIKNNLIQRTQFKDSWVLTVQ